MVIGSEMCTADAVPGHSTRLIHVKPLVLRRSMLPAQVAGMPPDHRFTRFKTLPLPICSPGLPGCRMNVSEPSRMDIKRSRFPIWIPFLSIAILFIALVAYQLYATYLAALESAKKDANNLTLVIADGMKNTLDMAEYGLSSMVLRIPPEAMHREQVEREGKRLTDWLEDRVGSVKLASAARVFDANGQRLYSSVRNEAPINIGDRAYFQRLRDHPSDRTIYTEVIRGRSSGRLGMFAVRSIRDKRGVFLGVALIALDVDQIQNHVKLIDLGKQGSFALRRIEDGAQLVRFPGFMEIDNKPYPNLPTRLAALRTGFGATDPAVSPVDGIARIYGYRKLGDYPFFVTIGIAESDYLADWRKDALTILVIALVFVTSLAVVFRLIAWSDAGRRRDEEALRKADAFKHSILNSVDSEIVVIDKAGVIMAANDPWRKFSIANSPIPGQLAPHTDVGTNYLDACRPEKEARPGAVPTAEGIRSVLEGRARSYTEEYPCHSPTEKRWFSMRVSPLGDSGDLGAVIIHTDISGAKRVESALRESEARFRSMADTAPVLIWIAGEDKLCNWFNQVWLDFTGRSMEQEMGNGWATGVHPEDFQRCLDTYVNAFDARRKFEMDYRLRRHDGEYRWILDCGVPRYDDHGKFVGYIGSCTDITERMRLAEEVQNQHERLSSILEGTHVGTWEWNVQTGETIFNERWAEIIGYTLSELAPISIESWLTVCHPEDLKISEALLAKHFAGELAYYACEVRVRHKDGHWVWVLDRGKVSRWTADGKPLLMSGTHQDISLRKSNETLLIEARHQAEAANVAKGRFLATMSHEIRTPMNGILGMAQMLLSPTLEDAERQDYARIILHSGQTLLTLLNDILDLSKVEAGKVELEARTFEPAEIVQETRALFAEAAAGKGLKMESGPFHPAGQRYRGDPYRLRQMLSNLVGNAVKFTQQGQIVIEVREVSRQDRSALLEFSVSDTGIGIPEDKHSLLFQPFSQTDSSMTRQFGGSGLGLSIVQSLARLMGGEVGVESRPGNGSRFWFRVPASLVEAGEDSRKSDRPKAQGNSGEASQLFGRVLVAEDDLTNRKVAQALLGKIGLTVVFADDGQQALNAITAGEPADLILMDLHMPVMDGYAATQRIRQWESDHDLPRRTIIALTADAFEADHQQCLAVGMDDFMAKPMSLKVLTDTLGKWLPRQATAQAPG